MGRHVAADSARRQGLTGRTLRNLLLGLLLIASLAAAAAFALAWSSAGSGSDPVDAAPVDTFAVVLSSPSCVDASGTTDLRLSGIVPPVGTRISACGLTAGQRVAIQYLAGHPEQARLAGTHGAGPATGRWWFAAGVLLCAALAVAATIVLVAARRRAGRTGRHARS